MSVDSDVLVSNFIYDSGPGSAGANFAVPANCVSASNGCLADPFL